MSLLFVTMVVEVSVVEVSVEEKDVAPHPFFLTAVTVHIVHIREIVATFQQSS